MTTFKQKGFAIAAIFALTIPLFLVASDGWTPSGVNDRQSTLDRLKLISYSYGCKNAGIYTTDCSYIRLKTKHALIFSFAGIGYGIAIWAGLVRLPRRMRTDTPLSDREDS